MCFIVDIIVYPTHPSYLISIDYFDLHIIKRYSLKKYFFNAYNFPNDFYDHNRDMTHRGGKLLLA